MSQPASQRDPNCDVIVVGLGVMGSAACWQLARRGVRVLGLDRFGVPNTRGTSHGLSRVFRTAYFEHPAYVPLLQRALTGWRELEAASGTALLTLSGGLYMGALDSAMVTSTLAAAELHGLECELLDTAALRQGWPQFAVPDGMHAVRELPAGVVLAEESVRAMTRLAQADGAELHTERVLDWTAEADGVEVRTDAATYRAARLILCPGTFANSLLQSPAIRIRPTRQVVGWFAPLRPERAGPERLPVWATEFRDGRLYYGLAALPDSPGLKLGSHVPDALADPQQLQPEATAAEAAALTAFAREWLPHDAGELTRTTVCLYENSADGHFILDRHPAHDNVLLFCGGSGHGFKFGPVIGEILADLALDGTTAHEVGFLGLGRFA